MQILAVPSDYVDRRSLARTAAPATINPHLLGTSLASYEFLEGTTRRFLKQPGGSEHTAWLMTVESVVSYYPTINL